MTMRFNASIAVLAVIVLFASPLPAEELLVGEPGVRPLPGGCELSFALAKPCDVTLRIVDAEGNVIRNLACGMVGLDKAAKPFAPGALSQKIGWDGKDDAGKPVNAKGGKVQVLVGMEAKFDKFILGDPDGYDVIRKGKIWIMKGRGDEYYLTQQWGVHMTTTRVFDANGNFLRQIWPPGLNKPKAQLERLLIDPYVGGEDWRGRRVPICVNHNATYYFGTKWPLVIASDGSLLGIHGYVSGTLTLWRLGPDGFPARWNWYPPWQPHKGSTFNKRLWKLAAGKDGDFYLADALHHVVGHFTSSDMSPMPTFTHSGTEKLEAPRAHLGVIDMSYWRTPRRTRKVTRGEVDDAGHFVGPDDIALDAEGNLLVLDVGRVKVYAPDGTFLRFDDRAKFPADPPVPEALQGVTRGERPLCFPHMLRVDSKGRLYIANQGMSVGKPFIVSDVEGKSLSAPKVFPYSWRSSQSYTCVDSDDNWYVAARGKDKAQAWKFSPSGEKLKFGESDVLIVQPDRDIKGLHVETNGDIYVVLTTNKWKATREVRKSVKFGDLAARGEKTHQTWVNVYGPDGKLKRERVVRSVGINDVAVDDEGNIFVIDGTMWHGAQMMLTAKGRVTGGRKAWPFAYLTPQQARLDPKTQWNKRFSLLSRLVKFSPEGGAIDGVDGAKQLWGYAGVSGVSPWNCGRECPAAQICLDAAGRLWVPDSFMYEVKVIDRAGNLIARVGAYGNADCKGGGGDRTLEGTKVVIDPEVPLTRPSGIAVWRDYLLISDMLTHRVLRCRLEYEDRRVLAINTQEP